MWSTKYRSCSEDNADYAVKILQIMDAFTSSLESKLRADLWIEVSD